MKSFMDWLERLFAPKVTALEFLNFQREMAEALQCLREKAHEASAVSTAPAIHSDAMEYALDKQAKDREYLKTVTCEDAQIDEAVLWAGHYLNAIGCPVPDRDYLRDQIAYKFRARRITA